MRWKTLLGLLIVTACGAGLAVFFRQPSTGQPIAEATPASRAPSPSPSPHSPTAPRGQIVPLVVEKEKPLTAFVPAGPTAQGNGAESSPIGPPAGRVVRQQPTVRASAGAGESSGPPQLAPAFPRPLQLLGIQFQPPEDDRNNSPAAAPAAHVPSRAEPKPVATPQRSVQPPRRHTIVDGDTLGALAKKYLGDAQQAAAIYEHNRHVLTSPEVLPIGVSITIPTPEEP